MGQVHPRPSGWIGRGRYCSLSLGWLEIGGDILSQIIFNEPLDDMTRSSRGILYIEEENELQEH
jgi:hypothetical protein